MGGIRQGTSIAKGAMACLLAVALSGCLFGSVDTHDSHSDGQFTAPRSVNPPADVPDALKSYVPRFAEMLEVRGLHLEKTDDPRAMQLRLTYDAGFDKVAVVAELVQGQSVVMHAEATTDEPENWSDKADLIDDLVDKTADKFEEQLGRLGGHVTLTPPPQG